MSEKKNGVALDPVKRTSEGLRDAIFDEIDALRNGTGTPLRANAVAKLAAGVVETVRMELEVARYQATAAPNLDPLKLPKPISLGH